MTVTELQSFAHPTVRWTEVCPDDHRRAGVAPGNPAARTASARIGTSRRSVDRLAATRPGGGSGRPESGVRSRVPARSTAVSSVAPGRRIVGRPASTERVRACHVAAPVSTGVVDDVPTWVLLACGIAFGVIMLLAVAFLGGPAYA